MIQEQVESATEKGADIVVFPEYLNVFLVSIPYQEHLRDSDSIAETLSRVFAAPQNPQTVRELFIRHSAEIREIMNRVYGGLAQEYGIYIVAGTYFAASPAPPSVHRRTGVPDRLTNRAVVYGPSGQAIYEQDKVYLTHMEENLVRLDPGRLDAARGVTILGLDVGITICRDTFFSAWDQVHVERDIWIDLRAEGTLWQQGRSDFTTLMLDRLEGSGSIYGTTVALTGEFLDLFWEGKSSISVHADAAPETIVAALSPIRTEILTTTLHEASHDKSE